MTSLWAFVERLVPRAGSALLMLLLAIFLSPAEVGLYTASIMIVMLVQSPTDGAVHGIAISVVPSRRGRRFLRSYQSFSAVLGTIVIGLGLGILWLLVGPGLRTELWGALPLLVIPSALAWRVRAQADLQIMGQWGRLARIQAVATCSSLIISIPMLLLTHSIVASSIQAALTEILFSAGIRRVWAAQSSLRYTEKQFASALERRPLPELLHFSGYQVLGWAQSQGDRIVIGGLAGTAALGQWSVAQNIARAAGDSLAAATTNVLRPALFTGDRSEERREAGRILDRGLLMCFTVQAAVVVIALAVLPVLLDDSWDAAIAVVPVMALSCVLTPLNWSLSIYLLKADRIAWATPVKVICLLMALPIGYLAAVDMRLAAWALVLREVVECVLLLLLTRRIAPWSAAAKHFGVLLAGAAAVLLWA